LGALLLDEPTSALDAEACRAVERCLAAEARRRGVAVVWITHDAAQAARVATSVLHLGYRARPTRQRAL
jgi:putative ABC transport system ATP-binding protein